MLSCNKHIWVHEILGILRQLFVLALVGVGDICKIQ